MLFCQLNITQIVSSQVRHIQINIHIRQNTNTTCRTSLNQIVHMLALRARSTHSNEHTYTLDIGCAIILVTFSIIYSVLMSSLLRSVRSISSVQCIAFTWICFLIESKCPRKRLPQIKFKLHEILKTIQMTHSRVLKILKVADRKPKITLWTNVWRWEDAQQNITKSSAKTQVSIRIKMPNKRHGNA